MASAGGVVVVMLQALVLGNQWVVQWMFNHQFLEGSSTGSFIRSMLVFPHWRLTPTGGFKYMFVMDFTLLVLLVLVAGFTTLGLSTMEPGRIPVGAVICGWWATFLAAAIVAFVSQLLSKGLLDSPDAYYLLAMSGGLHYGLFVGWLPGLAVMAAYVLTRPKPAPEWASGGQGGERAEGDVAGHPEGDDQNGHQPN